MEITYDHLPFTFLGLDGPEAEFAKARVCLLPVCYDHTTSYGAGSRTAPLRIIEASRYLERYDEELEAGPWEAGIHTLPFMEPVVSGPEEMVRRVDRAVGQILEADKFPVLVGGEHSLSAGAVAAAVRRFEGLSVLQLDAHADLRDSYQGSRWSHACVGARMAEICPVLQAGLRSMTGEESSASFPHPVRLVTAREIQAGQSWRDAVRDQLTDRVYVTLDVDVFDPSVLPATGAPEPGGLTWRQVTEILRHVFQTHRVVGMDVVELAPIPGVPAHDFTVARLLYRMIGYRFCLGGKS